MLTYFACIAIVVACGLFARDAWRTDKRRRIIARCKPETWEN